MGEQCPYCEEWINYDYLYDFMDGDVGSDEIECPHCKKILNIEGETQLTFHINKRR